MDSENNGLEINKERKNEWMNEWVNARMDEGERKLMKGEKKARRQEPTWQQYIEGHFEEIHWPVWLASWAASDLVHKVWLV